MAKPKVDRSDRASREAALERAKPIAQVFGASLLIIGGFVGLGLYLDHDKGKVAQALPSYTIEDAQKAVLKAQSAGKAATGKGGEEKRKSSLMPTPAPHAGPPTEKELQEARAWANLVKEESRKSTWLGNAAHTIDFEMWDRLPLNEQKILANSLSPRVFENLIKNLPPEKRGDFIEISSNRPSSSLDDSPKSNVSDYLAAVESLELKRASASSLDELVREAQAITPPAECIGFHSSYESFLRAKAKGDDVTSALIHEQRLESSLRSLQQSYPSLSESSRSLRINP